MIIILSNIKYHLFYLAFFIGFIYSSPLGGENPGLILKDLPVSVFVCSPVAAYTSEGSLVETPKYGTVEWKMAVVETRLEHARQLKFQIFLLFIHFIQTAINTR